MFLLLKNVALCKHIPLINLKESSVKCEKGAYYLSSLDFGWVFWSNIEIAVHVMILVISVTEIDCCLRLLSKMRLHELGTGMK